MGVDARWRELRDRCEAIDPDEILTTPNSDRPFAIEATADDRISIVYVETGEERTLWRDQFAVLTDRIDADSRGLSLSDLPPGVEPYVSVLSLLSEYVADESSDVLRHDQSAETDGSPFLRPAWAARTTPERVHDDAVLLVDQLERHDAAELESLSGEELANLYVLLSDVQRGADGFRQAIGDRLLDYIGPDDRFHGQFGTVRRTVRERRHLKDDATVLEAIDEHEIPHEWVLGVDSSKLDVVLAVTDLDEDDVYDIEEQVYVQKTAVEEEEKQSRLQGLKDRLAAADETDAAELRDDIDELEQRIDTFLAAG